MDINLRIKALTDEEIIEQIINIAVKYLGRNIKIILFGSRAKGNYTEHSDFDIAIEKEGSIPFDVLYRIREELDELPTLKSFDIVDLTLIDNDFKSLIMETGKVLYEGNKYTTK